MADTMATMVVAVVAVGGMGAFWLGHGAGLCWSGVGMLWVPLFAWGGYLMHVCHGS